MRRSSPARSIGLATLSVSQNAWIEMRGTGRSACIAAASLCAGVAAVVVRIVGQIAHRLAPPGQPRQKSTSDSEAWPDALSRYSSMTTATLLGIDLGQLARPEKVGRIGDLRGEVVLIRASEIRVVLVLGVVHMSSGQRPHLLVCALMAVKATRTGAEMSTDGAW